MTGVPGSPLPACCAPSGRTAPSTAGPPDEVVPASHPVAHELVGLEGGSFLMGCEDPGAYPDDGEDPVREVTLRPFRLDRYCVTNERFGAFVRETGYRTDAERIGTGFVFAGLLPDDAPPTQALADAPWWRLVEAADWQHPEGPWSGLEGRGDHPVVQVSWRDAMAFCAWAGLRLPTEAEWEYAARGGLVGKRFPWGNSLTPGGEHRMNVWQGDFPATNTAKDGYVGTAPVDAFAPNGFGLHNMTGNVWEWSADRWSTSWQRNATTDNPTGPATGDRWVLRGGSYLCHASYCWRYRTSARMGSTPDTSTGHTGFRCAADA